MSNLIKNNINYQTINSTQLYLNSATAQISLNGTKKSDMVFFFQDVLKINKSAIEIRLSIVNAQIPVSFYIINDNNNQISITINNLMTKYKFPNGNYNVNTFINTWYNIVGSSWLLSFNNITNKLVFSYTTTFTFSDDTGSSLLPLIGFNNNGIYTSIGNSLLSPFPVDFSGLKRLLISSSTFNVNNISTTDEGFTKILCSIPVSSSQNNIIYYNNITNFKNIIKNYEISSVAITIMDDLENFIDFNNIDWCITLQIDITNEVIQSLENLGDIYNNAKQEL